MRLQGYLDARLKALYGCLFAYLLFQFANLRIPRVYEACKGTENEHLIYRAGGVRWKFSRGTSTARLFSVRLAFGQILLPLPPPFISFFSLFSLDALRRAPHIGGRKRLASSGKRSVAFSRALGTCDHTRRRVWSTVARKGRTRGRGSFKGKISSRNSNDDDGDHRQPRDCRNSLAAFVLWAIRCVRRWNNVSRKSPGKSLGNDGRGSPR